MRDFWDRYATVYDLIWDSPFTTAFAAEIAGRAHGERVVDLGCGTGLATAAIGSHVIGVDSSPGMLGRAAKRCDQVVLAPAEHTGLPDGIADAVVVANVIHACVDPAAVIREALRMVRPGGQVLVTWPSDAATIDSIADAQRSLGWPRLATVRAKALATVFGLLSGLARVPRRTTREVSRELANFATEPDAVDTPSSLFGMQHMLLLHAPCPRRSP